jgi:hypothetical protein
MGFYLCLGVAAALILIAGMILWPYVLGTVGYAFFPIAIGRRKFRSYLDIHSKTLSSTVPDSVVLALVEKAYCFSKSDLVAGENPGASLYVVTLASYSLFLTTCLESREITKENHLAFALIGDELLAACGVDTKKLNIAL